MSMYNRYSFTKNVYKDYIVLIIRKNKYYSYNKDREVLDYIRFKDKTNILRKRHINYLVLDDLDIIEKYEYVDNKLERYKYLINIDKIFNKIKVVMSSKV